MFVKFHSDTRRTYKGFLARWQSTNVRVRTDPRHTSKATIECVIVVRLARRNGNREFKKLRRQLQRKRHIEIELALS